MTEGLEAFDAMIGTHPGGAYTTERHVFLHDVENHIVDANTARCSAMQEGFLFTLVGAEVVGGEWSRIGIDVVDGFIEIFVGADRQQRTKDFFFHAQGIGVG